MSASGFNGGFCTTVKSAENLCADSYNVINGVTCKWKYKKFN